MPKKQQKRERTPEEIRRAYENRTRIVDPGKTEMGRFLRALRLDERMSTHKVGKLASPFLDSSMICRWETGQTRPEPETLGKLLTYYRCPFDEVAMELLRFVIFEYYERLEAGYLAELERRGIDEDGNPLPGIDDSSAGVCTEGGTEACNQDG